MNMNFMQGHCFNFTVALHRLYKLPMVVLYGERECFDEEDVEKVCIHTVCEFKAGSVDFEGLKNNPDDLLRGYELINEPYDFASIISFNDEEEFWELVKQCGGTKNENAITKAQEIIQTDEKFLVLKGLR